MSFGLLVLALAGHRAPGHQAHGQVRQVSVAPRTSLFRFRRSVNLPDLSLTLAGAAAPARACATLDASVYAHAEPFLSDVRLLGSSRIGLTERPYALTSSQTVPGVDRAALVSVRMDGAGVLELMYAMPPRPYTEVELALEGKDFIATATVSGRQTQLGPERPVPLGTFTLFDLSSRHLGRTTTLPLRESSFPYLHVVLTVAEPHDQNFLRHPELIQAASVPPSREAQTIYTTIAETTTFAERGTRTVATFSVPARVPVEQIEFVPAAADKTSFNRAVSILASRARQTEEKIEPAEEKIEPAEEKIEPAEAKLESPEEKIEGQIERVSLSESGHDLRLENLTVPATLGLNARQAITLRVAIENGTQPPLALAAVRLRMRQRRICFDVSQDPLTMFYGAENLDPPQYGFSRGFNPAAAVRDAVIGPERNNASYKPLQPAAKSFSRRHPEALWLALLALTVSLAMLGAKSVRRT